MNHRIIKELVIDETKVDLNNPDIVKRRTSKCVYARMHYYKLVREYTNMSLHQIARTLKPAKDHATVLHGLKLFEDMHESYQHVRDTHKQLKMRVDYILRLQEQEGLTFEQSISKLQTLEEVNKNLIDQNKNLIHQINQLHERIERQNQYLVGRGHKVTE